MQCRPKLCMRVHVSVKCYHISTCSNISVNDDHPCVFLVCIIDGWWDNILTCGK